MSALPKQYKTFRFDTSSPTTAATITTLAAAVTTTSQTAVTLAVACGPDGTYFQIGSELMFVQSGGATTTPTVLRGARGTTAATYGNGATVNLPGHNTATLPQIQDVPNRNIQGAKVTSDINYQMVVCGGSDTYPGGATVIVLADNSPELGTLNLRAPGVGTVWMQFPSAGASGASASAGSGLAVTFPNTAAAVSNFYSASLAATGGVPAYTFSITTGSLPAGLSLNTSTGAITGTPTTIGSVSFTATVTDSTSATAHTACTIVVAAASGGMPAPNITSATATATYGLLGNQSVFGFAGVITLPTADPAYSHLASIVVLAFGPGSTVGQLIATVLSASFGVSTVAFSGGQIPQTASGTTWTLVFTAYNEYGTPTTSAYSTTATVQASGVSGFTGASENPATRTVDPITRQVHCHPTFVPILVGGEVPQNVTYLVSADNGVTYKGVGWILMSTVGQSISWDAIAPSTSQTWKVACLAGAVNVDPYNFISAATLASQFPTAVISSGFTVVGLATPAATLITSITPNTGAGGSFPYNVQTPDGFQYFDILSVTYDDAAARADNNAWVVGVTAQDVDASGNAIGPEQAWDGHQISVAGSSSTQVLTGPGGVGLEGQYGTAGYGYMRANPYPGGTPTNIAGVRLRCYVQSRLDQTNGAVFNSAASVLQTGVGSGAGYIVATVATAGAVPAGAIAAPRVVGTFGSTITVPGAQINGNLSSTVSLNGSQVTGTLNSGVSVPGSTITGSISSSVSISGSSVTGALNSGVSVPGSTITGSISSSVSISGGSLTGTINTGVSVPGSTITGSISSSVSISGSSVTGALNSGVSVPGSTITGSISSSVSISGGSLTGTINTGVSVPGSTITGSISSSVSISGSSVTGALNSGVSVPGSTITGSISSSVSISGGSLTGTINTGVSVPGSTITGSISSSVSISGSSVTGVLNGAASIAGSQINGVIITQANVATAVSAAVLGIGLVYDPTTTTLRQSSGAGAEMFDNPNFDFMNGAAPSGWYLDTGASLNTNAAYVYSGANSIKLAASGGAAPRFYPGVPGVPIASTTNGLIPCKPGDQFVASAWIVSDGTASGTLSGVFYFYNNTGGGGFVSPSTAWTTSAPSFGAWTLFQGPVVTVPSGVAYCLCVPAWVSAGAASGNWYVDNVSCKQAVSSAIISSVSATTINGLIAVGGNCTVNAGVLNGSISASTLASTSIGSFSGTLSSTQCSSLTIGSFSGTLSTTQCNSINVGSFGGNVTATQVGTLSISAFSGTLSVAQCAALNIGNLGGSVTVSQVSSILVSSFAGTLSVTQAGSVNIANFSGTLDIGSRISGWQGATISIGTGCIFTGTYGVVKINAATSRGIGSIALDVSGPCIFQSIYAYNGAGAIQGATGQSPSFVSGSSIIKLNFTSGLYTGFSIVG